MPPIAGRPSLEVVHAHNGSMDALDARGQCPSGAGRSRCAGQGLHVRSATEQLRILTDRGGFFGKMGHRHVIRAQRIPRDRGVGSGSLPEAARIDLGHRCRNP